MDINIMKQENIIAGIKYAEMALVGLGGIDSFLDGYGADKKYNDLQIAYYTELKNILAEELLELV